jgi:hypothetical protein
VNLTDREILELNELCGAVVDGTLSDTQKERLTQWLRDSEAARRYYVRALGQSASLQTYAAEIHAEAPDQRGVARRQMLVRWWTFGSLAAAAAIVLVFWLPGRRAARDEVASRSRTPDAVARLTAAKDAHWASVATTLQPGDHVRVGQRLELNGGFAEITFDSGARIVLEGNASLDVNSAWDATLRRGTLKASVPPEAIGFRISNPAVDVVDLGTEFTMIADGAGAAEVLVLKGEVEAAPRSAGDQDAVLLREREARRFAASGMSDVMDQEIKFARFTQPLALQRFATALNYVHWSFDDVAEQVAANEVVGVALSPGERELKLFDIEKPGAARVASPHGRALQLDGTIYAQGRFPGISGAAPHTIAFWVRVPEDAQLSEAYTMIAWGTNLKKLGNRPVQISWNRRPSDGALGALRTDFGGGRAIGTTALRDGRWHHVTVCFSAGEDLETPVQVKQYIDGRLESSTIVRDALSARAGSGDAALTDVIWLGRRLTGGKNYPERFRGDIDELFIADRSFEPNEIVQLMRDNRLPVSALARLVVPKTFAAR